MTGGKVAICAAQPAASCCLKPCSSWWNITFSSCEGLFHFAIALQNQRRLCKEDEGKSVTVCTTSHATKRGKKHRMTDIPWQFRPGSTEQACRVRGTQSPSPHCP